MKMKYDDQDADIVGHWKWGLSTHGYVVRNGPGNKKIAMHRIIASRLLRRLLIRGEEVDHINGDRTDNRRFNLRVGTHSQNQQNRIKPNAKNTSGFRGVDRIGDRWRARVNRVHVGMYATKEDAANAAEAKRIELGFWGTTR